MATHHQGQAPLDTDDPAPGAAAELGRVIDARWWWVLLAVAAVVSALTVLAQLVLARQDLGAAVPLEEHAGARVLVAGNGAARLFAMVAAVMVAVPSRRPGERIGPMGLALPAAKALAAFVTGLAYASAALLIGLVGTVVAWSFLEVPFAVTGRVVAMVVVHLLAVGLWGLIGLGVGLLFRSRVIAIVVAVVAFHLLPLLLSLVPWWQTVAGWVAMMPWGATRRLLDVVTPRRSFAGAGAALAILSGWAIILLGGGVGAMRYRTRRWGNQEMSR